MAHRPEAACLLQTGATYPRRIGLVPPAGDLIFVGTRRGGLSIYHGDAPIYHFDLEGRWQRAFIEGVHFRKGLDNAAVAIDRERSGENLVLRRRSLAFAEAADLDESIRVSALELVEGISSGLLRPEGPPEGVILRDLAGWRELLERVASWDASAWFAHRERYLAAYGPRPIFVPPDAQNAVILQATSGDGFFRTPDEFANHAEAVRRLLGRRAVQASGVLLADGAVLHRPIEEVIAHLDAIARVFPIRDDDAPKRLRDLPEEDVSLSGIEVILEGTAGPSPDPAAFGAMKARKLRRVTWKAGPEDDSRSAASWIDPIVRSGLALSIVVEGGTAARDSVGAILDALEIGRGTTVYLLGDDPDRANPAMAV